jgi:hypothetical protein
MFNLDYVQREAAIIKLKINQTQLERNIMFDLFLFQLLLLNITFVRLNQESDYVRLMLCSANVMFY